MKTTNTPSTYAEALAAGYRDGDCKFQRGYVSRKADISTAPVLISGGSRKGQLYVLKPYWGSSTYCLRQYLVRNED